MTRLLKAAIGLTMVTQVLTVGSTAQQEIPPIKFQPEIDSPIAARNPNAPAALGQFDFVIGDWDATITWQAQGGEPLTYKAKWHNHWVIDGQVVMQEWRGPFITGAELRAFDAGAGTWSGQNIYPGSPDPWQKTTAEFKNGQMVVVIHDVKDERGTFLNRETYFDISNDSFRMKSDRSYDGGTTWEKGSYEMICHRTK